MLLGTPSRKGHDRPPGARMAWPQQPATIKTVSASNHGEGAGPHLCENSSAMEPNNSEGH